MTADANSNADRPTGDPGFDAAAADGSTQPATAIPGTPENPLHTIATIPNLITLCRLILTVLFLVMFVTTDYKTFAVTVFIVAASTDWFDGQIARRFHQVSVFGKRFDPIMDRVLIFTGVAALLATSRLPLWAVAFLVARDCFLGTGSCILKRKTGSTLDVCYVGKACTFILMTGFAMLLLDIFYVPGLAVAEVAWLPGFGEASVSLGIWAVYIGCILSFTAASIYTVRGVKVLANLRRTRETTLKEDNG